MRAIIQNISSILFSECVALERSPFSAPPFLFGSPFSLVLYLIPYLDSCDSKYAVLLCPVKRHGASGIICLLLFVYAASIISDRVFIEQKVGRAYRAIDQSTGKHKVAVCQ